MGSCLQELKVQRPWKSLWLLCFSLPSSCVLSLQNHSTLLVLSTMETWPQAPLLISRSTSGQDSLSRTSHLEGSKQTGTERRKKMFGLFKSSINKTRQEKKKKKKGKEKKKKKKKKKS